MRAMSGGFPRRSYMQRELSSLAELVLTGHDAALVLADHVLQGDVERPELRLALGHVKHGQEELLEGKPWGDAGVR